MNANGVILRPTTKNHLSTELTKTRLVYVL